MAGKPRSIPKLPRGEGTMWWDDRRRQVVYEFPVKGHKPQRVRADGVPEARQLRAERLAELVEAQRHVAEQTVAAVLAEWRAFDCKGVSATLDAYDRTLVLAAPLGDRLIVDVTVADLERLYESLMPRLGQGSLIKLRSHLGMAFDFAVRRQYVAANVVRSSRIPAGARPPAEPEWLERDEFIAMRRHLVEHPSPVNTALLVVLLAGLRPGEALGLRWGAVNLDGALVAVQGGLRAVSQGRRHIVVDEVKTASSRRTVELPPDLLAALRRQHADRRLDTDLVFPTSTGKPISPANLRRALTAACKAVGDTMDISPHKLRHSFASALLDAGVPGPAVSRALGHRDGRMLATTYGHSMDDVAPTAAALNRMYG
jgi:integrase